MYEDDCEKLLKRVDSHINICKNNPVLKNHKLEVNKNNNSKSKVSKNLSSSSQVTAPLSNQTNLQSSQASKKLKMAGHVSHLQPPLPAFQPVSRSVPQSSSPVPSPHLILTRSASLPSLLQLTNSASSLKRKVKVAQVNFPTYYGKVSIWNCAWGGPVIFHIILVEKMVIFQYRQNNESMQVNPLIFNYN